MSNYPLLPFSAQPYVPVRPLCTLVRLAVMFVLFCASTCMFSGCVTGDISPVDISLSKLEDRGLVVVSYEVSGTYGKGYLSRDYCRPYLCYRKVNPATRIPENKSIAPSPDTYALLLTPGEYEFFEWRDGDQFGEIGGELSPPLRFSAVSGAVIYIGNILLTIDPKKGYKVVVADKRNQDLSLFYKKYTNIKPEHVRFAIMQSIPKAEKVDGR